MFPFQGTQRNYKMNEGSSWRHQGRGGVQALVRRPTRPSSQNRLGYRGASDITRGNKAQEGDMVTWLLTLDLLASWPAFSIPLLCSLCTVDWEGDPGHHSQQTLLLPCLHSTTEEPATRRSNRCDLGYNQPLRDRLLLRVMFS